MEYLAQGSVGGNILKSYYKKKQHLECIVSRVLQISTVTDTRASEGRATYFRKHDLIGNFLLGNVLVRFIYLKNTCNNWYGNTGIGGRNDYI